MDKIYEIIENALARAGYRILENDKDNFLFRDKNADMDYEIKINESAP